MLRRLCLRRAVVLGTFFLLLPTTSAAQAGSDLALVSPYENAASTDLLIDGAGVIHAIWQADPTDYLAPDLFYGSSDDRGRNWSEAVRLVEGRPSAPVGIPVLLQDGSGRLYAFWKELLVGQTGQDDTQERADAPVFGTLYYRVLQQGRWSEATQIGSARSILSWHPSVGPGGQLTVLWTQSPQPPGFMSTNDIATLLLMAQVDGSTPSVAQTVLESDNGALWGVSGHVDGAGVPHGFLLKNSDHPVLVRFDGSVERAQGEVGEVLRNYDGQRLPVIALDEAGNEHLLFYNGDPAAPAILDYAGGEEPAVVLSAPGGEIRDFRVTRSPGGTLAVAVAARAGNGGVTTDLYVTELRGGGWSPPQNVTVNQRRAESRGVGAATGTTYGAGADWHALQGAVMSDGQGRLGVLLINRRSGGAGTNNSTVGAQEYVYYAWAGEGTGRTPPLPTAPGAAPRPAPVAPAPQPSPVPPAAPQPAPGPQQPSPPPAPQGLPPGDYGCHYVSQYAGPIPTGQRVLILPGGRYQDVVGNTGTYDLQDGLPRWTSGAFAGGGVQATFSRNSGGQPMLTVTGAGEDTLYCVLHTG